MQINWQSSQTAALAFLESEGFSDVERKYDEIDEGANRLVSSVVSGFALAQVSQIGFTVYRTAILEKPITALSQLGVGIASLGFVPLSLCLGLVAEGKYEEMAAYWNGFAPSIFQLPKTISDDTARKIGFVSDQLMKVAKVAFLVEVAALAFFGHYLTAGALLLPAIYKILDADLSLIPREISLFIERYKSILMAAISLFTADPLLMVMFIFNAVQVFKTSRDAILFFLDDKMRSFGWNKAPFSLRELNAPQRSLELTESEIRALLVSEKRAFTLAPEHFNKPSFISSLPKDDNFDKLAIWLRGVLRDEQGSLREEFIDTILRPKLLDSEKFNGKRNKNNPSFSSEEYLEKCAKEFGQSEIEYIAEYAEKAMEQLVKKLTGKKTATGKQAEVEETRQKLIFVIPYMEALQKAERLGHIEFEDMLAKLAFESGDFCARGMRNTVEDCLSAVARNARDLLTEEAQDEEILAYEKMAFMQALQNLRKKIVEAGYKEICRSVLGEAAKDKLADDVHIWDMYRIYLTTGVLPISQDDEAAYLGPAELALWEAAYGMITQEFHKTYFSGLEEELIKEIGSSRITDLFRAVVGEASNQIILDLVSQNLSASEQTHRELRVVLAMLGVYDINWRKVVSDQQVSQLSAAEEEEALAMDPLRVRAQGLVQTARQMAASTNIAPDEGQIREKLDALLTKAQANEELRGLAYEELELAVGAFNAGSSSSQVAAL